MRHKMVLVIAAFAMPLIGRGCGKSPPPLVPVDGVVLLEGSPLANVEVRFIPMADVGAECIARGVTDKDGKFSLACKAGSGACACENRVVVREAEIPSHLRGERTQLELAQYLQALGGRPLPERYSNLADNPLVAQVSAEQREYRFELER